MRHIKGSSGIASLAMVVVLSFFVYGCAGNTNKDWDDIDYSKVRDRDKYENDGNYTQPTVIGCTNDDLYNCN